METVDIVYRWINPESVKRESKKRYRDNNELKYSLRSIELMPYVKNVFIVAKGDPPTWINTSDPSLFWIDEDKYDHPLRSKIPQDSEYAKYIIPDIKELGELFIMMDDDYYIGKSVPFSYWYKSGNIPIWPQKIYMKHIPLPMRKDLYKETLDRIFIQNDGCAIRLDKGIIFQFDVDRKRFRYDPFIAMKLYLSVSHKIETIPRDHIQIASKNKEIYPSMINHSTYCINDIWDESSEHKYQEEMKKYDKYRNQRYPNKSKYEIIIDKG